MGDFVTDDVSLRKVPRCAHAGKLLKEAGIQIEAAIAWAVERTGRGRGIAAGRLHLVIEQHQLWLLIAAAIFLKQLIPGGFRIGEDNAAEASERIGGRVQRGAAGRRRLSIAAEATAGQQLTDHLHRIGSEQDHDDRSDNT